MREGLDQGRTKGESRGMVPAPPRFRRGINGPLLGRREIPADRLESLLKDLGPGFLRRGTALSNPSKVNSNEAQGALRPCGLPLIDDLLGGGFPHGRLTEITGPVSSGRTSIALSLLAQATRVEAQHAALVDLADAFDPLSAEAAGAELDRILWVRATGLKEALRSIERLIEAEGLPLVIFDSNRTLENIPDSAWIRIARASRATQTSLIVLSEHRLTGAQAEIVLEMQKARPCFQGTPPFLEGMTLRAVLRRRRGAPTSEVFPQIQRQGLP